MQDEFYFIYNKLEEAKTDIEHFRSFLLEELNNESAVLYELEKYN